MNLKSGLLIMLLGLAGCGSGQLPSLPLADDIVYFDIPGSYEEGTTAINIDTNGLVSSPTGNIQITYINGNTHSIVLSNPTGSVPFIPGTYYYNVVGNILTIDNISLVRQ